MPHTFLTLSSFFFVLQADLGKCHSNIEWLESLEIYGSESISFRDDVSGHFRYVSHSF